MIIDATLQDILQRADDFTVVAEVYSQDAAPPFDPADAQLRLAPIGGLSFFGQTYDRRIVRFNKVKRTVTKEVNQCSLSLDNLDGAMASFELDYNFEGKILVVRLISRSLSDALEKSVILFAGRCTAPTSGSKGEISLSANQIVGAIDNQLPRRKFAYDDPEGRFPDDKLFEGFRYIPQHGTIGAKRKFAVADLFKLAKMGNTSQLTKKYDQYSTYSDLSAAKSVPVVFGRAQIMGTHACYADVGTYLHVVTIFCEGPIEDMTNIRTDDTRFVFRDNHLGAYGPPAIDKYLKRYGYDGGTGPSGRVQDKYTAQTYDPSGYEMEGNGYYSRCAFIFGLIYGSDNFEVDPAPGVISVILGQRVTVPDESGDWVTADTWSDNPAAHTYFVLTSPHYGKLDASWIDADSFTEAYKYNDAVIYDPSFADQISAPSGSSSFTDGSSQLGMFMASTGLVTAPYLKYKRGTLGTSNAFFRTTPNVAYASGEVANVIGDPDIDPNLPGPRTADRNYTLRRRYTSNVVVTEETPVSDFLHDVVFTGSQMFLSQDSQGRIKLGHKKPVEHVYANAAITSTSVDVDDVSAFSYLPCTVIVDPHTTSSEVKTVTNSSYSTATPTASITSPGTITSFTGSGGATPKSATVTIGTITSEDYWVTLTLDGIDIKITVFADDDEKTIAGWMAESVNGHPTLGRRYRAEWDPNSASFTLKLVSGTLTLDSAPALTHSAPVADPTVAPSCTTSSGGYIGAGAIQICYSYTNGRGETKYSPLQTLTVSANAKITFPSMTLPSGATGIAWYTSVQPGGSILRRIASGSGASVTMSELPKLTSQLTPGLNTTGCEIMRISAAFSDRPIDRSKRSRSNVIKGSFKWSLSKLSEVKNFVEVKFRDATQDFRLTTLNLKDDAHIDKIKKTNKLTLNGSAIDNYNQAYRIANAALAENLDANFLYQWTADREALMLEEGDVVAITDAGLGVVNLPVRIEQMEIGLEGSFPTVAYTARKYATNLYDDSVAERQIPVVVEEGVTTNFAP